MPSVATPPRTDSFRVPTQPLYSSYQIPVHAFAPGCSRALPRSAKCSVSAPRRRWTPVDPSLTRPPGQVRLQPELELVINENERRRARRLVDWRGTSSVINSSGDSQTLLLFTKCDHALCCRVETDELQSESLTSERTAGPTKLSVNPDAM